MPGAQPSKARVANVLDAIIAAGRVPGKIKIAADGSFEVETKSEEDVSKGENNSQGEPRKFGEPK